MFRLGEDEPALHRLPGLRMKALAERGLALPRSALPEYGKDWVPITRAQLPKDIMMRTSTPPTVTQRIEVVQGTPTNQVMTIRSSDPNLSSVIIN